MGYLGGRVAISKDMIENRKRYLERAALLSTLLSQSLTTSQASIERLKALRKLPVEERLALVLDRALLELSPLAGYNVYDTKPGANIRCVIGLIGQNPVMVIANDPSVKGGTYYPLTIKKHLRAQEIAETLNLPCLYLVDSGGAYLPMQEEVFPDKFHFGRLFFNQCRMSAKGNIQISVTLGSATAGGAYIPALSDISIIVQNTGHIFLGGPPLVKAATGLNVTAEELGGAKVHTDISGVADIRVENEEKGFELVKKLVGNLKPKSANFELNQAKSVPPRYDPLEIPYFLSENTNYGREILGRLLDDSYLDEFKPTFGETIICGFGRICGFLVGILMNDGILYSESAIKSTHFIQLCNKLRIPIIFLQNIVGFMVGTEYEHKGIAKDGAKMVSAVANSVVPKITVIIGASYGAGNYGMCGRAFDPVFLFAWPNSRIGVMGGKQAGIVLSLVGSQKDDIESFKKSIEEEYDKKTSAFYGTARLWDDGLILAEQTREVLKNCLSLLEGFEIREDFKPTYRF